MSKHDDEFDALAFALVYGRNDDRTIDAFNRLETALKKRFGEI